MTMTMIGIDPHKATHTAVAIDGNEHVVDEFKLRASSRQAEAQLRFDTEGRAYYERKLAAGKSTKDAIRSLKRRISDRVYRHLNIDAQRLAAS